jgi:hypothetical protein
MGISSQFYQINARQRILCGVGLPPTYNDNVSSRIHIVFGLFKGGEGAHINGQTHKLIRRDPAIEKRSLFANEGVNEDDGFTMEINISEVRPLPVSFD